MRVDQAAMLAVTASDPVNTHVAFTARQLAPQVPIIATADDPASVDILELAGCSNVLELSRSNYFPIIQGFVFSYPPR